MIEKTSTYIHTHTHTHKHTESIDKGCLREERKRKRLGETVYRVYMRVVCGEVSGSMLGSNVSCGCMDPSTVRMQLLKQICNHVK